jgi:hypothetical protein
LSRREIGGDQAKKAKNFISGKVDGSENSHEKRKEVKKMTRRNDKEIKKTWNTEDLDFDEHGRMIIKNRDLQEAFRANVLGKIEAKPMRSRGTRDGDSDVEPGLTEPIEEINEGAQLTSVNADCGLVAQGGKCPEIPPSDSNSGCFRLIAQEPLEYFIDTNYFVTDVDIDPHR